MAVRDYNGKVLKKGDRVKYHGRGMTFMPSDRRKNVPRNATGTVEGDYSPTWVYVMFDGHNVRIEVEGDTLEKI